MPSEDRAFPLGQFTYQKLAASDIDTASRDIKDLMRKSIVRLTKAKGRVYEVVSAQRPEARPQPPELIALEPVLREKEFVKNEDIRRVLGMSLLQARYIARRLVEQGWLIPEGKTRGRRYMPTRSRFDRS